MDSLAARGARASASSGLRRPDRLVSPREGASREGSIGRDPEGSAHLNCRRGRARPAVRDVTPRETSPGAGIRSFRQPRRRRSPRLADRLLERPCSRAASRIPSQLPRPSPRDWAGVCTWSRSPLGCGRWSARASWPLCPGCATKPDGAPACPSATGCGALRAASPSRKAGWFLRTPGGLCRPRRCAAAGQSHCPGLQTP